MSRPANSLFVPVLLLAGISLFTPNLFGEPAKKAAVEKKTPAEPQITEVEARGRAKLLHVSYEATLDTIHVRYFIQGEKLVIPSAALEEVFGQMARKMNVEARWLAVNAQAMNVDHKPQDKFEKAAVEAFIDGKKEFEQVSAGVYRRAAPIPLDSSCLKCHLPFRTSKTFNNRLAALVISMPIKK